MFFSRLEHAEDDNADASNADKNNEDGTTHNAKSVNAAPLPSYPRCKKNLSDTATSGGIFRLQRAFLSPDLVKVWRNLHHQATSRKATARDFILTDTHKCLY